MKIAIVIGHKKSSPGAVNENYDVSEHQFNTNLAYSIGRELLKDPGTLAENIVIVHRKTNYKNLPGEINDLEPDLIVSLHCNAFNKSANGCEMLYYHKSTKGKEVARIFQNHIVQRLDNKDRGIKPKTAEDLGGYLLRYTKACCIIAEPFFIDNDDELLRADECFKNGDLTKWYCEAINKSLEYLKVAK